MDNKWYEHINILSPHLWGKTDPYETIYSHSDKVAVAMEVLADHMPERFQTIARGLEITLEEAVRLACYIAGVHDIGKIIPAWQGQEYAPEQFRAFYREHSELFDPADSAIYKGYRHERGSFTILMRIWGETGLFQSSRIRRNLAAVAMAHHQKRDPLALREAPGTTKAKCDGVCASEWMECQAAIELHYREIYSVDNVPVNGSNLDVPCMIMSGLLIFADWMGSSLGEELCDTEQNRVNFKQRLDAFVSHMGVRCRTEIPDSFQLMWPWIESPRPLQEKICEVMRSSVPDLTIIEDSMGTGKTEAALYVANHILHEAKKAGTYIALPTSATANQMHQRVDELLNRFDMHGSRLLHATAWLSAPVDEDDISDAERFLSPSRMGLLAPYGVGTIDQVLTAILKARYGNLRMTGIAGKVLILDEVHAYDAYMTKELQLLLQWCAAMDVPVILLSATLPEEKRNDFITIFTGEVSSVNSYPRITAVGRDGKLIETTVGGPQRRKTYHLSMEQLLNQEKEIAALALKTVEGGGTLCLTVNTVARARTITKYLDEMTRDTEIYIFHSRYSMARRQQIEEECVRLFGKDTSNRPRKAILVATQVVEQSLDIDFDYYITDICPIDLILQRIGRQFRHEGVQRPCSVPEATILVPAEDESFGAAEYVYDQFVLTKTRQRLESLQEITVPDDIQGLVDNVYEAIPSTDEEFLPFADMKMKDQVKESTADRTALGPPGRSFQFGRALKDGNLFDEDAKSRLAEPSVRLAILPEALYRSVIEDTADREMQKRAYEYSFTIRAGTFDCTGLAEGKRMLRGVCLLQGENASSEPYETAKADGICMDYRYGVMIKKGN